MSSQVTHLTRRLFGTTDRFFRESDSIAQLSNEALDLIEKHQNKTGNKCGPKPDLAYSKSGSCAEGELAA